jgi:hypothetical protein
MGGTFAGLLLFAAGAYAVTQGADPAHPTTTTLSCVTPVETNHQSHCIATILDASPAGATTPQGTVTFETSSTHGSFSAGQCNLTANGLFAACAVNYTPTEVDGGTHTLTATYHPTSNHRKNQGTAQVKVEATKVGAAAPNTFFKKKPRRRTAQRTAKFKFSSDQPGSTFQCKLDKKPFRPCRSPLKIKKLKAGRHTFQVKATSSQGLADLTPAVFKWRVGKVGRR